MIRLSIRITSRCGALQIEAHTRELRRAAPTSPIARPRRNSLGSSRCPSGATGRQPKGTATPTPRTGRKWWSRAGSNRQPARIYSPLAFVKVRQGPVSIGNEKTCAFLKSVGVRCGSRRFGPKPSRCSPGRPLRRCLAVPRVGLFFRARNVREGQSASRPTRGSFCTRWSIPKRAGYWRKAAVACRCHPFPCWIRSSPPSAPI